MTPLGALDWCVIAGLDAVWHGVGILAVAGLPRVLRRGEVAGAPKGTPQAFGLFWMDQYAFIGLALAGMGGIALVWGAAGLGLG